jgi:hypothetical protein
MLKIAVKIFIGHHLGVLGAAIGLTVLETLLTSQARAFFKFYATSGGMIAAGLLSLALVALAGWMVEDGKPRVRL